MKRSEMIDAIAKRLNPIGISDETCEEILSIVEELGMKPPLRTYDGNWHLNLELPMLSHTWEPENEKTIYDKE